MAAAANVGGFYIALAMRVDGAKTMGLGCKKPQVTFCCSDMSNGNVINGQAQRRTIVNALFTAAPPPWQNM